MAQSLDANFVFTCEFCCLTAVAKTLRVNNHALRHTSLYCEKIRKSTLENSVFLGRKTLLNKQLLHR